MEQALERLRAMLDKSMFSLVIFTAGYARADDAKAVIETGMLILLDKPLLLVVERGCHVPEHLRRCALASALFTDESDINVAVASVMRDAALLIPGLSADGLEDSLQDFKQHVDKARNDSRWAARFSEN